MKLYTTDNTELMEVSKISTENGKLLIVGTIMGAMPIQAVLSGTEMRKAFSILSFGTILSALRIFFFRK